MNATDGQKKSYLNTIAKAAGTAPAPTPQSGAASQATQAAFDAAAITGVVMPERPVFDKIMALWLFLAFGLGGKSLDQIKVQFWGGEKTGGNVPSNRTEAGFDRRGLYAIDVGENKYQSRRKGSACECVAEDIGLVEKWGLGPLMNATHAWVPGQAAPPKAVESGKRLARSGLVWLSAKQLAAWGFERMLPRPDAPGVEVKAAEIVERLVSDPRERVALQFLLLASRNNGTGFLKDGGRRSVVWLLRELEKPVVADDRLERHMNARWTVENIVRWVLDVIEMRFRVEVGEETVQVTEEQLTGGTYEDLFGRELCGTDFRPFTLATYLRDMIRLGVEPVEVVSRGNRLLEDAVGTVELQNEKAEELLEAATIVRFAGGAGAFISCTDPRVVNNERVPRALFRSRQGIAAIVLRNTAGQVAVLTQGGIDLVPLARELVRREPKLWFADPKNGCLLNRGHSFTKVPATQVSVGDIIAMLEAAMRKGVRR